MLVVPPSLPPIDPFGMRKSHTTAVRRSEEQFLAMAHVASALLCATIDQPRHTTYGSTNSSVVSTYLVRNARVPA